MSKKSLLLDYLISLILSISLLASSFFLTKFESENEAKSILNYYGNEVSSIYLTSKDLDQIKTYFSKIEGIRISIFDLNASVLLDINTLDKTTSVEDRKDELEANVNKYYYKDSLTLGYPVFYYCIKNDDSYIRVGMAKSKVEETSSKVLLYGSLILILIEGIYFYFKYRSYKNSLSKINKEISKLEALSNVSSPIKEQESLLELDKAIENVSLELEEKMDSLKRESNKTQYVLDSMEEGLLVLDKDGSVILVNKYLLDVLNLDKLDLTNKHYRHLLLGEKFDQIIKDTLEKGTSTIDINIGNKIYALFSNEIPLSWLDDGKNKGISIIFLDVTSSRNNEQIKKEFFQNASHELKTPLTTIIGYSELLSAHLIKDKKEITNAELAINKESKRMKNVIDDMLSLSTLEAKMDKEDKTNLDLKQLIEETISSFSYQIKEKNIEVSTSLDKVNLLISKDEFERLFRNLFSNAIIYNKLNGKINVELRKNYLKVSDSGIGIDEKDKDAIFTRFYRVDKSRSREEGGTGLGLAIVKHICINNGFKIKLDSRLEEGSTFTIYFKP